MSDADTLQSVIDKCETYADFWSNFTPTERRITSCHFCNITDAELEILFASPRCLPSDFDRLLPLIYVLYGVIFTLSVPGNALVVYTVYRFPQLHTVAYIFIANLAVSDLLMMVFCVPFSVTSIMVLQYWPFGNVLCVFVNYVQAISVFGSAYTLVAISVDRYLAIVYPLRPRFTIKGAKYIIAAVWLLALVTTLPVAIVSGIGTPDDRMYQFKQLSICREFWPEKVLAEIYSFVLAILQYFLPLTVLIFTYYRIMVTVWGSSLGAKRQTKKDNKHNQTESVLLRTSSGNRSPNKMMWTILVVVCVYSICWLPFNILQIVRDCWPFVNDWHSSHILWFVSHWLAMSHTVYNPMILCWMNAKIRKSFSLVFRRPHKDLRSKASWSSQRKATRFNSASSIQLNSSYRRTSPNRFQPAAVTHFTIDAD